jgi:UDP-N-acetylmuramoyl-tripeptide--D-alanyl-D-alanine ligase
LKTLALIRPVIAVAGSSGKTTTKEMLAAILRKRWRVFKSIANRNNRAHMIEYSKQIRPYHKAMVLEFGMSRRGDLHRSCQIIRPNIGIITMVGTAHIGNVGGTVAGLIRAKSELILNMKQTGMLFLNADDLNSKRLNTDSFKGKIVTVGINNTAVYQAIDVNYTENGMSFRVKLGETYHYIYLSIYGKHNVYNALLAIAVSHSLGFSPHEIKEGLRTFKKLGRRLIVYHLKRGVRLIDDTFNANPNSVKAAS